LKGAAKRWPLALQVAWGFFERQWTPPDYEERSNLPFRPVCRSVSGNGTSFAPETTSTKRSGRDRTQTKTQQNQQAHSISRRS